MIEIIFGICVFLLAVGILNYGVDFCFYLRNRYCRYHIGRWEKSKWVPAIERVSVKWLKRTPTVRITDNSRYILADVLQRKYRSTAIQSWQKAALILGLLESGDHASNTKAQKAAEGFIREDGNWKKAPRAVDCGMLSYAILKASDDINRIKPAMDDSADLIQRNLNEEGMISYTGGKDNPDMYVDTIGLTCPFLALYGKTYGNQKFEDVAFNQISMFHQYGLLKDTALPNHAFDIHSKLPLGVYGWGRGVGWYVIGLVETYQCVRKSDYRNTLKDFIRQAADEYCKFQRKDGGFGSILQSSATYDSSATAALAWFYVACGNIFGEEKYYTTAEKCLNKLMECTRMTGAIDWCQGDTKGIGVFSQMYDTMPFAQGMALRAVHGMNKLGR